MSDNLIYNLMNERGKLGNFRDENPVVPTYWSAKRDLAMKNLAVSNDFLIIALYNLTIKMVAISPKLEQSGQDSDVVSALQEQLTRQWSSVMLPGLLDLLTADNGMFIELLGSGDDTLEPTEVKDELFVPATGLKHLSTHNCTRTGDAEYPVVYKDLRGRRTKLHKSRVFMLTDMDFGIPELNGVGFCAISRALQTITKNSAVQDLLIDTLYDGLVGEIILIHPMSAEQIEEAYKLAELRTRSKMKHSRHKKNVFIGLENEKPTVERIPLRRLPEGYTDEAEIANVFTVLASAIGVDARELMPASMVGATKADATIQHMKSNKKFILWWLERMTAFLNEKFLRPDFTARFTYVDELAQAAVRAARESFSETVTREVELGLLSRVTILEQYLDEGYITNEQYERELLAPPFKLEKPVANLFAEI